VSSVKGRAEPVGAEGADVRGTRPARPRDQSLWEPSSVALGDDSAVTTLVSAM
jgi:hypothetical protein